jgi:hypothetical protein
VNEDYETGFESWQIPDQTCVGRWIVGGVGKTNRWTAALCGKPAVTMIAGAALCERHQKRALEWHQHQSREDAKAEKTAREQAEALAAMKLRWKEEAQKKTLATSWVASGPHLVYYAQRLPDGLIKIGTSKNLRTRLGNLTREHGELRLLLTHLGDRERETRMHKQFEALWVEGEWFRPEAELLAWILEVRRRLSNRKSALSQTVPLADVEALAMQAGLSDVA